MAKQLIHFCTPVHNRADAMVRLWESFRKIPDPDIKLSIYDWCSTDHPDLTSVKTLKWFFGIEDSSPFVPWNLIYRITKPFPNLPNINRSRCRNIAFDQADPKPSDIVFFVDCDMVLPLNIADHVRDVVKPGVAYFPVCYSLYKDRPAVVNGDGPAHRPGPDTKANGWWRHTGRGNCAFVVSDFLALGKWNEAYGENYGREDDDIYTRAGNKLEVVRDQLDGFFHHWHPRKPETQNPSLKNRKAKHV
jgi:hypothetical protein